jgi:hypothetical protein
MQKEKGWSRDTGGGVDDATQLVNRAQFPPAAQKRGKGAEQDDTKIKGTSHGFLSSIG